MSKSEITHLLKINLAGIARVLTANNLTSASISYSGRDDEGRIDAVSVTCTGSPTREDLPEAEVYISSPLFDRRGVCGSLTGEMSFRDACEQVADDAIEPAGHADYESGDRGYGTLTIYADGHADLNHRRCINDDGDAIFEDRKFEALQASAA